MTSLITKLMAATSVATGAVLAISNSASAFSFTTNYTGAPPKGDIFLDSVVLEDGELIEDFSYISDAYIVENDEYHGGNSGAASADKGDNATTGIAKEDVGPEEIVQNLSTNNLNNIIDTEDSGAFQIDLEFDKGMDNLLVWERGMNSDLAVQAFGLDEDGNEVLVGTKFKITRDMWQDTGFDIDTTEIGGAQSVGSYGLSIEDDLNATVPVTKVRFFSESSFNGPDWKFIGTDAARGESVPEPGMALGLGVLGAMFAAKRARNA